MVVGDNESTATKNAGKKMAILIAMALQRYDAVFSPPCWRHGMARMAIRVSGQRQKHGASLLGEIAKWLLRFSGDHHLTTPDTSIPADPAPPPPDCSRRLPPPSPLPLQLSSSRLSAPSCRRPSSPPLSSCRRRRRRRVFRCRF